MRNNKLKAESLKFKDQEFLEQYLEGKAPLHADRLNLPSGEELDAAEAEFDRMAAERKQSARRIPLWTWVAGIAAAIVLVFMLWPKVDTKETAPLATNEIPKAQEHEQEELPLMAQLAEPERSSTIKKAGRSHAQKRVEEPTEENIGVDEPLEGQIAGLTIVPTSADLAPSVTMRLGGHCTLPEEKEPLKEKIDVDEPLTEKIVSLTIVPTSADLGPGKKMRLGPPCPITAEAESLPEEQQPSPIPPDKQALADIYLAEMALQVAYERQAQAEALRAYAASITGEEIAQPIIAF